MSITVTVLVFLSIVIGVTTAILLYKTSHAKKELTLKVLEPETPPLSAALTRYPKAIAQDISKIVAEETRQLVQDLKQEYSVKYQVAVEQKNREVESVRKQYQDVKEHYEEGQQLFKKTESEKKTTDAVLRGFAEGLVVVNEKNEVLFMNPSAEKLLGVEKEKKIGKPIYEDVREEIMISLSRETEDHKKIVEFTSNDENVKKILRSSSAVLQNEEGQTIGMVNILTDVTKQRELDDVKSKFISNVTHELRTPIVAMQKAISIVVTQSAGPLNETQLNFLNIISRNMGHLSRLVEDLLDTTKIDYGKLRLTFVPTRLDKVILEVCETLDTWAKSKELKIVREVDRNCPEIPFDAHRITQVLNNLIGNAIKFTSSGGTITVKNGWSSTGDKAEVSVIDTGVGIAKENMTKLFKRFEQFGDQEGISGTGLGLSISKEIVERHGGEIFVESTVKKGSKFTFTLPIKQTQRNAL